MKEAHGGQTNVSLGSKMEGKSNCILGTKAFVLGKQKCEKKISILKLVSSLQALHRVLQLKGFCTAGQIRQAELGVSAASPKQGSQDGDVLPGPQTKHCYQASCAVLHLYESGILPLM